MSKLPEIIIKDAYLLRENASKHLHELWGKDSKLADDSMMEKIVTDYTESWKRYEEKIVRALVDQLGVNFRKNIIEVYIAPWFRALSDPIIVGVKYSPDHFVDILTHELTHSLLTDNSAISIDKGFDLATKWKEAFGREHSFTALVHIPVHAIHKYIYLDVLKDKSRYERDLEITKKYNIEGYVSAWKYVNDNDYKEIISKTKKIYEQTWV